MTIPNDESLERHLSEMNNATLEEFYNEHYDEYRKQVFYQDMEYDDYDEAACDYHWKMVKESKRELESRGIVVG